MPVNTQSDDDGTPAIAVFDGRFSAPEFQTAITRLAASGIPATGLLADFSSAEIDIPAAEFMQMVDNWLQVLGPTVRTALVFQQPRQKDQAMLFETKAFLAGARLRVFEQQNGARSWLASWTGPRR